MVPWTLLSVPGHGARVKGEEDASRDRVKGGHTQATIGMDRTGWLCLLLRHSCPISSQQQQAQESAQASGV
jgi:hypothetical protein